MFIDGMDLTSVTTFINYSFHSTNWCELLLLIYYHAHPVAIYLHLVVVILLLLTHSLVLVHPKVYTLLYQCSVTIMG